MLLICQFYINVTLLCTVLFSIIWTTIFLLIIKVYKTIIEMQKGFQLVDTDLSDPSVFYTTPNKSRRCPVMVTIGDYNETSVDLQQLLEAGMNIAKLKIAETSTEERSFILERLKKATQICCRKYDVKYWPVATCVALKNSMVKTGLLESEEKYIEIKEDSEIILTNEDKYYDKCNEKKIYVNNPFLTIDTKIGTEISINSDEILAICTEIIDRESIKCVIIKGGFLSNVCDFCTRVEKHSRPFITQKDWEIVDFAIEYEIDMIILNYVTNREVVKEVKKYVKDKKRPMILSGIATMKGLKNIDDIMKESDGIVLSREFLPYEVSATYRYRLPYIQKWLAAKCFQVGKPLFICGGVFEEALRFGKFRYPQTTDVCNAILDGVSGFILKSCAPSTTLSVKVLKSINEISCFVEPLMTSSSHFMRIIKEVRAPVNAAEAAVIACVMAARQTNSRVIILPTVSGATVRVLNWIRPPCLVITVSSDVRTTRRLHIYRGVTPLLFFRKRERNWKEILEDQLLYALDYAIKHDKVEYDDTYVSLQKHSQFSSFCDTIVIDKVALGKKRIECPETYEDTMDYAY